MSSTVETSDTSSLKAVTSTDKSDIDVVDLSLQLVSMHILTKENGRKRNCKRVRFTLPDCEDVESSCLETKRKRCTGSKYSKECHPKKRSVRKADSFESHLSIEQNKKKPLTKQDVSKACRYSGGDDAGPSEAVDSSRDTENMMELDKNDNCSICNELKIKSDNKYLAVRKSKTDSSLSYSKRAGLRQIRKKRKGVVSKKSNIKASNVLKQKLKRKRKNDGRCTAAKNIKKRRLGAGDTNFKVKHDRKGKGKHSFGQTKRIKSSTKYSCSKSRGRSRSTSRPKDIINRRRKALVKKSLNRIKKQKSAKQKFLEKRLSQSLKRTTKKKMKLKQLKSKTSRERRKRYSRHGKSRRRAKIKITPIDRELEVLPPMRVSLLKYLTIKIAYDERHECCRRCCWDDWEEIDIDDIIDDYD